MGRQAAFGGPFGDLAKIGLGTTFTVTTGQGTFTYRVLDVRRAGDPVPPALTAGAGRLVLVTAAGQPYAPSGTVRVDADLVEPAVAAPPLVLPAGALAASERVMGTDSSSLVSLVLWCQALLISVAAVTWARLRWGRAQTWVVGVPLLLAVGVGVADQVSLLLPNLL